MKMTAKIKVEQLKNHPGNVRKTYTGIEELAESIKVFGILQNLTVVPEPGHEESLDSFYVVCGNRRLMAARAAGLYAVPCVIIDDMSEKDQISTMMAENMARSSLTPYEEGQGIQLMLDLGETEDRIAQKTGLSRSTIRHRVALAKLDQNLVDKKMSEDQQEGFFQMSLTDLYRLEKVKDEKERNRILQQAKGPENLSYLINQHLEEIEKEKRKDRIIEALEKAGIQRATKQQVSERYSTKYGSLQYYHLDQTAQEIKVPKHSENAFYVWDAWSISVYDLAKKKSKGEMSEEEKKQAEKTKKERDLRAIVNAMADKRKAFIKDILAGKYKLLGKEKDLWTELLETTNVWIGAYDMCRYLYEENKDQPVKGTWARAMVREIPMEVQIMAIIAQDLEERPPIEYYDLNYNEEAADRLKRFYDTLEEYGFSINDEAEKAVLDGSHEFYKAPKKAAAAAGE